MLRKGRFQFEHSVDAFSVYIGQIHFVNAGGDGPFDHFASVGVEFGRVEMCVGVDERHAAWVVIWSDKVAKKQLHTVCPTQETVLKTILYLRPMRTPIPLKDQLLVGLQFLLFTVYLLRWPFGHWTFKAPAFTGVLGMALATIGLMVIIWAFAALNRQLWAFPTPKEKGVLIQHGPYRWVRHPIYTGVLGFALGWALWSGLWHRLVITLLLLALFYFKARYEERLLSSKYPEYTAYKVKTRMF